MRKSERPKKVWIKATRSYLFGNVSACVSLMTLPLVGVAVTVAGLYWLVLHALEPDERGLKFAFFLGASALLCITWWLIAVAFNVFHHFVGKFYMTTEEKETLMKLHRGWCDACDAAESAGLPEPKRPY